MKMKKISFLVFIIVLVIVGCTKSSRKAAEYNNSIIKQENIIAENYDLFFNSFKKSDSLSLQKDFNKLKKMIKAVSDTISQVQPFNSDSSLLNAAKKLNSLYTKTVNEQIDSIINLFYLPPENYSIEYFKQLQQIEKRANDRIKKGLEYFDNVQSKFIKRYNLDIN